VKELNSRSDDPTFERVRMTSLVDDFIDILR
jgi:hypothetical protein